MAVFLVLGIIAGETVGPVFLIFPFIISFSYFAYRIRHGKCSMACIVIPFFLAAGYICMSLSQRQSEFLCNLEKKSEGITCTVTGQVYRVKNNDYGYTFFLKKVHVRNEETENCIVYAQTKAERGDIVEVTGNACAFEPASNPGEFDIKQYYATLKTGYKLNADTVKLLDCSQGKIYRLADKIKNLFIASFDRITDEKYAKVFEGMFLGDRDNMDEELSDMFTACGIGHILAISGLHISMIGMGLYKLVRKMGAGYILSMVICGSIIIFYGVLTGNSISTLRALVMFITAVYANAAGRTYDILSAASLAAVIMLFDSPMLVHNSGFILSFSAVFGLVIINEKISRLIKCSNKLINAIIAGFSIQLGTLPFILYYFYKVPVLSLFLNLIVIPLMTVVMLSAMSGGFMGIFDVGVGKIFITPGVLCLKLFEFLCGINQKIPWAVKILGKPKIIRIVLYYISLALVLFILDKYRKKILLCGTFIPIAIIILRFNNSFEAAFLDVGQGDGIFIRTPDGVTILVDCGSSDNKQLYDYTLKPFLLSYGVDKIDYVIITHCDSDHISGIKELLTENEIKTGTLLMPSTTLCDEAYTKLWELGEAAGAQVKTIYDKTAITTAKTVITCLYPDFLCDVTERNAYSTVLSVEYNDFKMLLTGDISETQEQKILNNIIEYAPYDILKAAHHGSEYSNSAEFLSAASPECVVISCGKDNSYGHPHKEALNRFREAGAEVLRTDESGAIEVKVKGDKVTVDVYK